MDEEIKYISDRLTYNETSGELVWKSSKGRAKEGCSATWMSRNGYLSISLTFNGKRKNYLAHRIAWAITYGVWPIEVDHIDFNRSNNALGNLQEVDRTKNSALRRKKKRNLLPGVTFHPKANKSKPFMAQCGNKYIGYFECQHEAHRAYMETFREIYGEYPRNGYFDVPHADMPLQA